MLLFVGEDDPNGQVFYTWKSAPPLGVELVGRSVVIRKTKFRLSLGWLHMLNFDYPYNNYYKHSLRVKYIKKDNTKEQLYVLPLPKFVKDNELARPKGVGDPMWSGFMDLYFSDQFKVPPISHY